MRKFIGLIAMLVSIISSAAVLARNQEAATATSPHVVEVVARKFEFTPNEIHAKAGERVQIKLSTADRAHGLKLNLYPEGASEDGHPGLIFDHPQDDAKVEKKKDRLVEFTAARPGTYDFKCSVQCSMGHGHDRMTGKLIVDSEFQQL